MLLSDRFFPIEICFIKIFEQLFLDLDLLQQTVFTDQKTFPKAEEVYRPNLPTFPGRSFAPREVGVVLRQNP
jgi:hypothetical protein